MATDPKLYIIIGYDKPGSTWHHEAEAAALAVRNAGRDVEIIGDGTYAPTLKDIRDRIASHGGPAEIYLASHGEKLPEPVQGAGGYVLTLSDGQERQSPQLVGTLPSGAEIDRSQIVTNEEFFRALPPNTVGVLMGSCHSELALKDVNALPSGAKLFVTSTADAPTMADRTADTIVHIGRAAGIVSDGSSLTEAYGTYVSTFRNTEKYTDGSEFKADTPTRFAISGQGEIDLAQAAKDLKGYPFPDKLYHDIASSIGLTDETKINAFSQSLKKIGERVTSGEVGNDPAMDNRSYNIVLTEIARVANEKGISMTQALDGMEQVAKATRAMEEKAPDQPAATAASIGAGLRGTEEFASLASMQRIGDGATLTEVQAGSMRVASQAQGAALG